MMVIGQYIMGLLGGQGLGAVRSPTTGRHVTSGMEDRRAGRSLKEERGIALELQPPPTPAPAMYKSSPDLKKHDGHWSIP